jgi:hypothetical protein
MNPFQCMTEQGTLNRPDASQPYGQTNRPPPLLLLQRRRLVKHQRKQLAFEKRHQKALTF